MYAQISEQPSGTRFRGCLSCGPRGPAVSFRMLQSLFAPRHAVEDVFTPRRPDVNKEIYVQRSDLEDSLKKALSGSLHTIVFGESGSGKSWLYKKVLADIGAEIAVANCANAQRHGSLTKEIEQVVRSRAPKRLTEVTEGMDAKLKVPIAEGGLNSARTYEFRDVDPLIECFRLLREDAGKQPAVLIIDNLEMIFSSTDLMNELASIIILLDDTRYAHYAVKLLVVGVPSGVKQYLARMHGSVANRTTEIPEVSSLSKGQVSTLIETGFIKLLRTSIDDETLIAWKEHIYSVTMGLAQPVQEYCEQLGYVVRDADWCGHVDQLNAADAAWLNLGLQHATGVISELMNERETRVGRRNQVLFTLGRLNRKLFHVSEVETTLRHEFQASTANSTTLAVGQMLDGLTKGQTAIIKRVSKGPSFEFRDARFAMALRVLLSKDSVTEKVTRIDQAVQT